MPFNTGMDARENCQARHSGITRIVIVLLLSLLASGLWQGYGAWLFARLTTWVVAHGA